MPIGKKGFQKGIAPNPKGRKRGSRNRTSQQIQLGLLKLIDDNLDKLQKDFEGLEAKDRISLLISLAKHCTPPAMNPERLTEEQLLQIIQYIKDNEKQS